jgi:hypothetical protein
MPLRPVTDNARLARVLVRLAAHGATEDGRAAAKEILGTYAGGLALRGVRPIEPSLAIDELVSDPLVVTLEGPTDDPRSAELRRAALNLPRWVGRDQDQRRGRFAFGDSGLAERHATRDRSRGDVQGAQGPPGGGHRQVVKTPVATIGLLGGSGLYALAGLDDAREVRVSTPFGDPSDALIVGNVSAIPVAFLARHGRKPRPSPR